MFLFQPCFMMVQHDAWHGVDPFFMMSLFLFSFFHGTFSGAPLKFADLFDVTCHLCGFVIPLCR